AACARATDAGRPGGSVYRRQRRGEDCRGPGSPAQRKNESVFVLTAKLPLQAVDDAFNAGLKDVGGDPDRPPAFLIVGEDRQDAHQSGGALVVLLLLKPAMQQADIELLQPNLGELRVVL